MTPEAQQRYNDLDDTVKKLSNGHRGDPLIMSDGIVNISKTLQVMLSSDYITEVKCIASHDKIIEDIQASRFGWKALAAVVTACATLFGLGVKLIDTLWGEATGELISQIVDSFNYFV